MSLFKHFPSPWKDTLELSADAFNLFNHPNLGVEGFDGNISSLQGTFLEISQTRRGGRTMQLRLKYEF